LYKNRIFRQTAERGIAYVYGSRAAEFQQVREPIEALSNKIKEKMGLIFKDGA
jgi:hypothetical protein